MYIASDVLRNHVQSGADGDGVFKTYRIESLNANKIGFETDVTQFQRALKVASLSSCSENACK